MATKIGINGFGCIGRQVLKGILDFHRDDLQVVAINDLTDPETNAHLFKYDSNYGRYPGEVAVESGDLVIDGDRIVVLAERDPAAIPWGDYGVEIVVESTGYFTDGAKARGHLNRGAKKVIISAPAKNEDLTVVLGVNDDRYDPAQHDVISNASCTTNCLAPVAKVLDETVGIKSGVMSTIHAYTNDQVVLDTVQKDLRRAPSLEGRTGQDEREVPRRRSRPAASPPAPSRPRGRGRRRACPRRARGSRRRPFRSRPRPGARPTRPRRRAV